MLIQEKTYGAGASVVRAALMGGLTLLGTRDAQRLQEALAQAGIQPILEESGYAPVDPPGWIAKLRPELVLLSVAADDRDGLPSPETLAVLEVYTMLRTDRNG